MDTTTTYLGMRLAHPFIAGASPLSAHLDGVRKLEDGGAAAIVLHSLFEEQITEAESGRIHGMDRGDSSEFAGRLAAFPPSDEYPFEPHEHLEHVRRVKEAVKVPVIASLNGTRGGAWLRHATLLQDAGADALEVNFYEVVTDLRVPAEAIEGSIVRAVRDLKGSLKIPVAVKLAPFFSAFANVASQLDKAGADGLVIFNRFYQPDIDIHTMTVAPRLELSTSSELLLRLRWLAILHGRIRPSLAVTGGIDTYSDGIKAILAGAHAVQMVSSLLRHGPAYLSSMCSKLAVWMDQQGIVSVDEIRGRVSMQHSTDPANFERANYIRTLHRWSR